MNSMPSQPETAAADDHMVTLPAQAGTVTAEDLRVGLVLAADLDHALRIDASRVEGIGQAVLQLLVAARAEAERAAMPFEIVDPSPAFIERVSRCGLAETLGIQTEKDQ